MTIVNVIPAATLVLLRATGGEPELLMIERGGGMAFAAGAMVFPGGRVDPGDKAFAAELAGNADPVEMAARIAAIRETIEEVGIAVGLTPMPDAEGIARLRSGLAGGAAFASLLSDEGLAIDPAVLVPFARWQPDLHPTRNFDTLFFVAEAPAGAIARPDGGESVAAVWGTARALLADAAAGRHHIIFPTRRNLEKLANLASLDAVRRHAADHPVRPITPWIEERAGEQWLCIPEDCGYPTTAERAASAMRG